VQISNIAAVERRTDKFYAAKANLEIPVAYLFVISGIPWRARGKWLPKPTETNGQRTQQPRSASSEAALKK
jgi:hypothetical protein